MPDGGALQEHLLAVAEGLAALGAARARRVEVVVVAGLCDNGKDVYTMYSNELGIESSLTWRTFPEMNLLQ